MRFGFVSVGVTGVGASIASPLSCFYTDKTVERIDCFLELFVLCFDPSVVTSLTYGLLDSIL
jgi:hypothetical protein